MGDERGSRLLIFPRRASSPTVQSDYDALRARTVAELSQVLAEAASTGTAETDFEAVDDEHVFAKRFKFVVCRRYRQHTIDLKHEADLTDAEIRLLWRTSSLVFRDDQAVMTTSRTMQAWGYIQLVVLGALILAGLLALLRAQAPTLVQFGQLMVVETLLFALSWGIHTMYVRPNQIRSRAVRFADVADIS